MKFLREPLVQFLLIGAVLFGLGYARKGGDSRHEIVVSAGKIAQLTQQFQAVWMRPPTRQELEGLIESYVREEVFYREAVARGLDQDDQVIRRRLMTKLQFVTEDLLTQAEPSDSELGAWLAANPDRVRRDPVFTFSQVYVRTDARGPDAAAALAGRLLAQLRGPGGDARAEQLGDRSMLEHDFRLEHRDIALKFGDGFAAALDSAPVGRWSGPIPSGYGLHLVLVRERTPGFVPPLAEVRSQVLRELQNQRRESGLDSLYRKMRGNYHVSVVRPAPPTDSSGAAR
jgi:hypothetical protein